MFPGNPSNQQILVWTHIMASWGFQTSASPSPPQSKVTWYSLWVLPSPRTWRALEFCAQEIAGCSHESGDKEWWTCTLHIFPLLTCSVVHPTLVTKDKFRDKMIKAIVRGHFTRLEPCWVWGCVRLSRSHTHEAVPGLSLVFCSSSAPNKCRV